MIPATDVVRAVLVAAAAVLMAHALRATVLGRDRRAWALLMVPYLVPSLLVGYAYSNFALSLIHYPALNAWVYATLLSLKLAPVATLARVFIPDPLTDAARHCERLAHGRVGWRFRWRAGCAGAWLVGFVLVFLLAFSEFEMASLMSVKTWTVRLFDGHAGGLSLTESLALAAWPFAVELAVLGGVLALFRRQRWEHSAGALRLPVARWYGWMVLVVANVATGVVPAWILLRGTAQSWRVLAENFALGREVVTSLVFGIVAGVAAYVVAPRRGWMAAVVSLPGLLGAMTLALLVAAAIQTPLLIAWRDTPVPLAVTLTLLLLPLAVLLRIALRRAVPLPAVHAARMLDNAGGRDLVWVLSIRRHVWAVFLLGCLGYLDLTASAILAPVGTAPVCVRLYNLMHYGQTAILSGMVVAVIVVPGLLMVAVTAGRRIVGRL